MAEVRDIESPVSSVIPAKARIRTRRVPSLPRRAIHHRRVMIPVRKFRRFTAPDTNLAAFAAQSPLRLQTGQAVHCLPARLGRSDSRSPCESSHLRAIALRIGNICGRVVHPLSALILLSIAASPLATVARELPERFEATFWLEAAGTKVARTQWSLDPSAGGTYVSTSRTETAGVFSLIRNEVRVERSEWTRVDNRLQPLTYRYVRTGRKPREIEIKFDWEANVAFHDSSGTTWRLPVSPGTMDKFSYIFAMMRDLSRGKRHLEYTIADGGRRLKRYVLTGMGEERIETALGTLDTIIIRRDRKNSKRQTTLWCAKELGFLPVKIIHLERDGKSVTLHIESLSGIKRRTP